MFNQATIMGFLGNDPAIHTFQNGSKSATFTVAVNESYIDRQGHKQTITTWIPCVAYGKLADIVQQIARKGVCVFVQGKLQQNKPYTNKDGVMVQSYSIIVDTIRLCGGSNGEIRGEGVASFAPNNYAQSSKATHGEANYDASASHSYNQNTTHRVSEAGNGNTRRQVVDDIEPNDIPF